MAEWYNSTGRSVHFVKNPGTDLGLRLWSSRDDAGVGLYGAGHGMVAGAAGAAELLLAEAFCDRARAAARASRSIRRNIRSASWKVHSRSGSETVVAVADVSVAALVVRRRVPGGNPSLPLCLGRALGGGCNSEASAAGSNSVLL